MIRLYTINEYHASIVYILDDLSNLTLKFEMLNEIFFSFYSNLSIFLIHFFIHLSLKTHEQSVLFYQV
jgi:hypothetical protein